MEFTDKNTTLGRIKSELMDMCKYKGWGDENGIQHAQHITSAMMVEMMELLEHFIGIPEAEADSHFADHSEKVETSEEAADVMMYALHVMNAIDYDVSAGLCQDFSDDTTTVSELREYVGKCTVNSLQQVMRLATMARFMLEDIQWMSEDQVQLMMKGGMPEKAKTIGDAFVGEFREMLLLADRLDFDVAGVIMRKIGIVYKRVYEDSEPER